LVEIFLRKYFQVGQTVLDPFCGSGTTLIQANELGINAVGYDISAFNVLMVKAKSARYDLEKVKKEILDILSRVERQGSHIAGTQLSFWQANEDSTAIDNEYLNTWFAHQALIELVNYRNYIHEYEYQDILKVILSRSARSARLTTHFDLDFPKKPTTEPYYCYKHSRICEPTNNAYQFLRRYSLDTIARLHEFASLRSDAHVVVKHEDSGKADFPPIDGVITSPPYVGLIDYHDQHRYAYELLGLTDLSENEIGAAFKGKGQKAQKQYQESIANVFQRCAAAMPPGGHLIVVANDRLNLYDEIAILSGLDTVAIVNRHVNRRTGRRSSEFYESVFIWQKP
jgi:DNA modification methylase